MLGKVLRKEDSFFDWISTYLLAQVGCWICTV